MQDIAYLSKRWDGCPLSDLKKKKRKKLSLSIFASSSVNSHTKMKKTESALLLSYSPLASWGQTSGFPGHLQVPF